MHRFVSHSICSFVCTYKFYSQTLYRRFCCTYFSPIQLRSAAALCACIFVNCLALWRSSVYSAVTLVGVVCACWGTLPLRAVPHSLHSTCTRWISVECSVKRAHTYTLNIFESRGRSAHSCHISSGLVILTRASIGLTSHRNKTELFRQNRFFFCYKLYIYYKISRSDITFVVLYSYIFCWDRLKNNFFIRIVICFEVLEKYKKRNKEFNHWRVSLSMWIKTFIILWFV